MKIFQYALGQMRANCYLLVNDNNECLIIDPGDEGEFILEQIQRKRLKPVAILATHGHFDHVMAVGEIQLSFKIPFYINKEDEFLIKRVVDTAKHFLDYKPIIIPLTNIKYINNFSRDALQCVSTFKINIIDTPGHTPGSCCFHFAEEKIIFTGDTLFKDGIGRYDYSYSNKQELFESIKKILTLPEETIIYSGHGDETTVLDARLQFSFQSLD